VIGSKPPSVGLSTASAFPDSTADSFVWAAALGYDSVEVLVGTDVPSQDAGIVRDLSERYAVPVCAIHAPCLLVTRRVWGTDPWGKLERAAEMAAEVGADLVVVHPPWRWQREYAEGFVTGIAALERSTGIGIAVENMYPWRASSRRGMEMYVPGWDPSETDYAHTAIDLSHAGIAGSDPIAMAERLGPRLSHVHLTDSTGSAKDEHLVPGRGTVGAAAFLRHLAGSGFAGHVVVEINTRRCVNAAERERDLAESLEFAREHLSVLPQRSREPEDSP
jgi:sugar phosphate isomerase/epimerase